MLPEKYQWITVQFEPEGDPWLLLQIGRELEADGNLEGAATVYDRAFGLAPQEEEIRQARQSALEGLAVAEHGILFRYVPYGSFLMGRIDGEPDERPWHPVWLSAFWMSETPISWEAYCRLMDWEPPPTSFPRNREPPEGDFDRQGFHLYEANKIRLQYCEDQTTRARDWHSHAPGQLWRQGNQTRTAQEVMGAPERTDPNAAWEYATKPMVAVGWQEATELADRLSTAAVRYALPTEAQWEKAARGGLIGARHAWGDARPSADLCDFDRFRDFSILPMKTFAANGYGLYAVNGCVWEWTRDWYDRDFYRQSPDNDPEGPPRGEEKVLRGGSWADCGDVLTVSFRMSRGSRSWREANWGDHLAPNIGFRLCRFLRNPGQAERREKKN
jgi:formylglycine-generating enzyme required for sulfatase activity